VIVCLGDHTGPLLGATIARTLPLSHVEEHAMRTGLCLISVEAVQSLTRSDRPGVGMGAVPAPASAWSRCLAALREILTRITAR
jgi:hypothetical protein